MRVLRTFAFADLSGFTNYTTEHGDDAAGRVLGEFRAVTRRLASERGVRVAKWLGDGCMVVAIDQEDMIAFALDLEREATAACDPLSLRIGVATGRALLFEGDDYIGSAVNLAARLCDAAGPGEVLVPVEQAVDLPDGVTATPHGVIELHGFPQPVTVANLAAPMVRAATTPASCGPARCSSPDRPRRSTPPHSGAWR
jgi:class 3 adenylate cyclase